jgi:hypothetical protein
MSLGTIPKPEEQALRHPAGDRPGYSSQSTLQGRGRLFSMTHSREG